MKTKLPTLSSAPSQRGQSLVELAISLTVMLLLLAGAVTFGMALFSYVAIRDAAQEGALYGSFNPYFDANNNSKFDYTSATVGEQTVVNWNKICERVKAASDRPVNMSTFTCVNGPANGTGNSIGTELTISGKACENGASPASGVKVTVGYDYPVIMPYIGGIIGSQTIHLRAEVTDTILEPKCP